MRIAFVLLILFASPAQANSLFVEPYVGIAKLEVRQDLLVDVADGFFLGAKAGYRFKHFFFGGDYQTGGPFKFGAPLEQAEWDQKMLGFGIGADYKVARFWFGYYLDGEFSDSINNYKIETQSYKIGVALFVSKHIRASLDFIFYDVKKYESFGIELTNPGFSMESAHVSLSLPFGI